MQWCTLHMLFHESATIYPDAGILHMRLHIYTLML